MLVAQSAQASAMSETSTLTSQRTAASSSAPLQFLVCAEVQALCQALHYPVKTTGSSYSSLLASELQRGFCTLTEDTLLLIYAALTVVVGSLTTIVLC